jgi:hypothetical protein
MPGLWRDLRYALRILAKSPGYTAVVLLALTLGIGANAIVFTLTNAMFFKGFPFDRNDRVVYMGTRNLGQTGRYTSQFGPVSYPDFRDWRAQAKSLTGIAAATFEEYSLSDAPPRLERNQEAARRPFRGRSNDCAGGGYAKAAQIIANSLPSNKQTRSGDLGELLNTCPSMIVRPSKHGGLYFAIRWASGFTPDDQQMPSDSGPIKQAG